MHTSHQTTNSQQEQQQKLKHTQNLALYNTKMYEAEADRYQYCGLIRHTDYFEHTQTHVITQDAG